MLPDPLEEIKEEWLPLRIIHFSLMAGILIFLAAFFFLNPDGLRLAYPVDSVPFLIMNLCVALIPLLVPPIVKRKLYDPEKRKAENRVRERFYAYRNYKIIQWALLEGPALLGIVSSMVLNNAVFLLFTLFHLAFLIAAKPSETEFLK